MNDEVIHEIFVELAQACTMSEEQERTLWERIVENFEDRGLDYEN